MPKQSRVVKLYFSILVLGMAILACSLPIVNPQSPSVPSTQSSEKPSSDQVIQSSPNMGDLSINQDSKQFQYITDEFTMSTQLADELNSRPEIGITNPNIYLQNGNVEIHAQYNQSGINLPLVMKINLFINSQSQIDYEIISAKIGPLSLPGILVETFSSYFDALISNNFGIEEANVRFDTLVIDNGILSVSGYYR